MIDLHCHILPGFDDGVVSVQDGAAQLAAPWLLDGASGRVLDACAAPGGKTAQLAAAGATVTAVDISKKRLRRMSENMARLVEGLGAGVELGIERGRAGAELRGHQQGALLPVQELGEHPGVHVQVHLQQLVVVAYDQREPRDERDVADWRLRVLVNGEVLADSVVCSPGSWKEVEVDLSAEPVRAVHQCGEVVPTVRQEAIDRNPVGGSGVDYLATMILDCLVDATYPVVDSFARELRDLDDGSSVVIDGSRCVLVDHARARAAQRRGGPRAGRVRMPLDVLEAARSAEPEQILALDEALTIVETVRSLMRVNYAEFEIIEDVVKPGYLSLV